MVYSFQRVALAQVQTGSRLHPQVVEEGNIPYKLQSMPRLVLCSQEEGLSLAPIVIPCQCRLLHPVLVLIVAQNSTASKRTKKNNTCLTTQKLRELLAVYLALGFYKNRARSLQVQISAKQKKDRDLRIARLSVNQLHQENVD